MSVLVTPYRSRFQDYSVHDTIAFHFPISKSFNLSSIPSSLLNTTRHLFPSTSNERDRTKTFTNGSYTNNIDSQALMFFLSYYPQYTSLSPLSQDIYTSFLGSYDLHTDPKVRGNLDCQSVSESVTLRTRWHVTDLREYK